MNYLKVFVLLAGMVALFGVVGGMLGGQSGMLLALASALGKLQAAAKRMPMAVPPTMAPLAKVNPLSAFRGGIASLFSTHSPTEERIARLEAIVRNGLADVGCGGFRVRWVVGDGLVHVQQRGRLEAGGLGEKWYVAAVGAHGDDRDRRGEHAGRERARAMAADVDSAWVQMAGDEGGTRRTSSPRCRLRRPEYRDAGRARGAARSPRLINITRQAPASSAVGDGPAGGIVRVPLRSPQY